MLSGEVTLHGCCAVPIWSFINPQAGATLRHQDAEATGQADRCVHLNPGYRNKNQDHYFSLACFSFSLSYGRLHLTACVLSSSFSLFEFYCLWGDGKVLIFSQHRLAVWGNTL